MWFNKLNIRGLKYFIYFFTLIFNHLFSLKLLINPLSLLWLLCDTLCNNYFLLYHKSTEKPQNTQSDALSTVEMKSSKILYFSCLYFL